MRDDEAILDAERCLGYRARAVQFGEVYTGYRVF